MDGREKNAQTTAAGRVFSQSFNATLRQTPVSDPLSVTAEAKTGGNEISDSSHHTATAKQRQGQTKLWAQMLQICPNYYYAPRRGRKTPVLSLLTA